MGNDKSSGIGYGGIGEGVGTDKGRGSGGS